MRHGGQVSSARPAYLGVLQEMIAGQLAGADLAALLDVSGKLLDSISGSPAGRS